MLEALTANQLYFDPIERKIFLKDAAGAFLDARSGLPGADVPEARLKHVRLNNSVRSALQAVQGALTLMSPDPLKRQSAAEAVFKSRDASALPALETALRDVAKDRSVRALEWHEKAKEHQEKRDLIEGYRLGAKHLSARGAELEKIADAAKPRYDSLDESQKHRFGVLLHEVFQHPDHRAHWGRHPDERSDYQTDGDHEE